MQDKSKNINCSVKNCRYNRDGTYCDAPDKINVSADSASGATLCETFESRPYDASDLHFR